MLESGRARDVNTFTVGPMCGLSEGLINVQNAKRQTAPTLAITTSDWTDVAGDVPQGKLAGPKNFLNMMDALNTNVGPR